MSLTAPVYTTLGWGVGKEDVVVEVVVVAERVCTVWWGEEEDGEW